MDKRINKKLDLYISSFKNDIRTKADELGITENPEVSRLLMYVYEYNRLSLGKEDFMKRKRNKMGINVCERCTAKRSNGEQCTRRKKTGHEFCGTHTKGIPHGVCEVINIPQVPTINKIEVRVQDINGIMYFIDTNKYAPYSLQWPYNGVDTFSKTYGRLYTWPAVKDQRNICPTGWRIPSVQDWEKIISFLGGYELAGGKMKEVSSYWSKPNTDASNTSFFSARGGAYRNEYGYTGNHKGHRSY